MEAIKGFFEESAQEISEELVGKMDNLLEKSKEKFGHNLSKRECPEDFHTSEEKKFAAERLDGNPYARAEMGILGSSTDAPSTMDLD